ncbi:hypothetical protein GCM10010343_66290 [Streptomyces avidinii]|nr:hypothetical protein GCM10010343_66290 [Streptomyces avidinii]
MGHPYAVSPSGGTEEGDGVRAEVRTDPVLRPKFEVRDFVLFDIDVDTGGAEGSTPPREADRAGRPPGGNEAVKDSCGNRGHETTPRSIRKRHKQVARARILDEPFR